jgi:hypothetical protein
LDATRLARIEGFSASRLLACGHAWLRSFIESSRLFVVYLSALGASAEMYKTALSP